MKRSALFPASLCALLLVAQRLPAQQMPGASQGAAEVPGPRYSLLQPVPESRLREMDTDRPNVTNSPNTIDAGHWQVEIGIVDYAESHDDSAGDGIRSRDLGFGYVNLRVGVLGNLELNLAVDTFERDTVLDRSGADLSRVSGVGNTVFGGKWNLWANAEDSQPGSTSLALQPQFEFPTGRTGLGNSRFEPSVLVPFQVVLPRAFHLGLQTGLADGRNLAGTAYATGLPFSAALDRTVIGDLDVYVEYASELTTERHVITPQTFDVGGTYPLGKRVVLDVGVNLGLNRAAPNVEIVTGISISH